MTDVTGVVRVPSASPSTAKASAPPGTAWMRRLGSHVRAMRDAHPDDTLCVVFDIDGTIIDTRHLVVSVLVDYDRRHGTDHFRRITVADIDVHEAAVAPLLDRWHLTDEQRTDVQAFYDDAMWTPEVTLAAHHPYRGVMEVIRWFQLQPDIVVALNTGRPESLRAPTLRALATLAAEHRVNFTSDLLLMNDRPQGVGVTDGKVGALRALQARGLRIAAVIDNEPENLEAMAAADDHDEILLMHASTIFLSSARPVRRSVVGTDYDLAELITPADLPGHVTLVAGDLERRSRLVAALRGSIGWLAAPVRLDPYGAAELAADPAVERWDHLDLSELLADVRRARRSVRLDLQSAGAVDAVLRAVATHPFDDDELWFSGRLEVLGEQGIRALRRAHPGATISCPVDFLAPLMAAALEQAVDTLDLLREWGVDRVSLSWNQPNVRRLLGQLEAWGHEVDLTDLPDRVSTLEAAVLLPRSVTSAALVDVEAAPTRGDDRAALPSPE